MASGDALTAQGLDLVAGGEALGVDAELRDLDGELRWGARSTARRKDANALMHALAGKPDVLFGTLGFDADLGGRLAGAQPALESAQGRVRFDVSPGELRGTSMLEATLRALHLLGAGGALGRLLPGLSRPKGMERYTGDGFDRLSATLDLRDGKAHTQDFRLVTPFYEVRLAGAIALADLGLDAKGEIALGSELAGALLGDLPLAKLAPKQLLVIPLPAIRGTLVEPEPEPDWRMLERALLGNLGGVVEGAGDLLKGVGKGLLGR